MKLHNVIIVGRMNIGKSTLFNRLSSTVKSLIYDEEGVTRDYITDVVTWKKTSFMLIDSAGLGFRKQQDPLQEKIRLSALKLLDRAQLILFVVDGTTGALPEDLEIANAIRKTDKPVILVINKADRKSTEDHVHDFDRLGFKQTFLISAQHGRGITELCDAVVADLELTPAIEVDETPTFKVALIGKPNVGKSSILNALLQEERSLVTEIAGTTREAIAERIQFYKESIEVIDTPGVRRPRSVEEELEQMMVKRSLQTIREADIVLLVLDASEGKISNQELTLIRYAFEEQYKGLIILLNKQDLMHEELRTELEFHLSEYKYLLDRVESLNISAKTGKNIGRILPLVNDVWQRYSQQFTNSELDLLFKQALQRTPIYKQGQPLRVFHAKQASTAPITITLAVDNPVWYGPSQLAFFENILRDHTNLKGVPVHITVRKGRFG